MTVLRLLGKFWKDERGATVVEYGVLAVFTAIIVMAGVSNGLNAVVNVFNRVGTALTSGSP